MQLIEKDDGETESNANEDEDEKMEDEDADDAIRTTNSLKDAVISIPSVVKPSSSVKVSPPPKRVGLRKRKISSESDDDDDNEKQTTQSAPPKTIKTKTIKKRTE